VVALGTDFTKDSGYKGPVISSANSVRCNLIVDSTSLNIHSMSTKEIIQYITEYRDMNDVLGIALSEWLGYRDLILKILGVCPKLETRSRLYENAFYGLVEAIELAVGEDEIAESE